MAGGKRILIADDDPDILDLLESYLVKKGYEVVIVNNGKDAIQKVEYEKFDLLLLDVMMPYIDGYHVAHEISSRLEQNMPRIIIMTSRDVSNEKGIALLSGAQDMIQKPFSLAELENKIDLAFKQQ
ncbi:MAG: response regulator [Elusimicrobia bacterium]|nr:response regulator [Elusimicrobiota bacterium]